MPSKSEYKLFYWNGIPGRGEYVRMLFEYSGTPYTQSLAPKSIVATLHSAEFPQFAPPVLQVVGAGYLSQTPAILAFLAPRLGLAGDLPDDEELVREMRRARVSQLCLTALDVCNEAHDTHHPVSVAKYYEDQKDSAALRSEDFRKSRIPKFFKHFEAVLSANDGAYLIGDSVTAADLTLFHTLCGLRFAFPKRMAALEKEKQFTQLFAFEAAIAKEKPIAEYLASDRRTPFGNGVFRHYEELDGED